MPQSREKKITKHLKSSRAWDVLLSSDSAKANVPLFGGHFPEKIQCIPDVFEGRTLSLPFWTNIQPTEQTLVSADNPRLAVSGRARPSVRPHGSVMNTHRSTVSSARHLSSSRLSTWYIGRQPYILAPVREARTSPVPLPSFCC